jgi:hypothetical protein
MKLAAQIIERSGLFVIGGKRLLKSIRDFAPVCMRKPLM